jgi:hypothetical protein
MGQVFVDILWISASALLDPVEASGYKMLPHLLSEYETVFSRSEPVALMVQNIRLGMYERPAWERRIADQVGFGDAALREASRNLDFPPAAVFYLQTARAYYATALADSMKQSVMGLITKPINKLHRMSKVDGVDFIAPFLAGLHLQGEPSASLGAIQRIHKAVSARGSPGAVQKLGGRTRGHYLYSISALELEYREKVARTLIEKGDWANANFYLRFWAYSLSRCPIILDDARMGRVTSFYVPFKPLRESVMASCPEIIEDMETVLGRGLTRTKAEETVLGTRRFRDLVATSVQGRGLALPPLA